MYLPKKSKIHRHLQKGKTYCNIRMVEDSYYPIFNNRTDRKIKRNTELSCGPVKECLPGCTKLRVQSAAPHNLVWWPTPVIPSARSRHKRVRSSDHPQANGKFKASLGYTTLCVQKPQRNTLNLIYTLD